tara:strand:- start:416 stop:682 length:267 start_codon:yes stop_codon:yes gene_type:complete
MIDTVIPGEALIYERANGVVYARYRDPPHSSKPRWIIGGSNEAFDRATNNLFSYSEWQHMIQLSENNTTLKKQIDRMLVIYYTIKDEE